MSKWQPIETAPKDGSDILAHWKASGTSHVVYYALGRWCDDCDDEISTPTHWMPLPEPPT